MKNQVYRVLLVVSLVLLYHQSLPQCTPAPPAVNTCSGGNGAASNGLTINSGETYWFSGGPSTFASGITFNGGGTLRVCGNLTLNSLTMNGGGTQRIIIESGGSLTLNVGGDLTFNGGFSITNRGSFTVNHGIHMQNANNRIWNDATTAYMSINGTLEFNSNSSKLINKGTVNVTTLQIQGSALAGAICLEDGAIVNATNIINNYTGSIAYNGSGAYPACVSVSTSAQRNNNVASSSLVDICAGTGISYSGGGNWGSATVTNNCATSCNVLLPQDLLSFNASPGNDGNKLQWITADISPATTMFYVEASDDGVSFHTIGSMHGMAGESIYTWYDHDQSDNTTTRYYRLQQIVPGGRSGYSQIISVRNVKQAALQVFPNPIHTGGAASFIIDAPAGGAAKLSLVDVNGKTVMQKTVVLAAGSNRFDWNVSAAGAGIYIARVEGLSAAVLYSRTLVITK